MDTRIEHIDKLIAKAIEDIRAGNKGAAIGKLSAARGNLVLIEKEDHDQYLSYMDECGG